MKAKQSEKEFHNKLFESKYNKQTFLQSEICSEKQKQKQIKSDNTPQQIQKEGHSKELILKAKTRTK